MRIIYTKSYDSTLKKLKKHVKEYDNLNKILLLIKNSNDFASLIQNPLASMYGFEKLRYFKEEVFAFNLCKNGGVIRLIVIPKDNNFYLVYISYKHYEDFDIERVIYYDE